MKLEELSCVEDFYVNFSCHAASHVVFCIVLQSSVMPKCGRMVGFNAGNYHGVQAVRSGQRCAIAMWYTLDPTHREQAHDSLYEALASLEAATASHAKQRATASHAKQRVEL